MQLGPQAIGSNSWRLHEGPSSAAGTTRAAARPMTVAAIDIGSNSVHMVTARVGGRDFEIIDRVKEMVGLARGTLTAGRLSPQAMEFGFRTLAAFKRLAERQGADPILAVATSAVREAANGGEFVLRAWEELGLHIDVITGDEEARLIFEAVRHAVDFRGERPLVIDIGGGSVEVVLGSGKTLQWRESLKLGVVRMTERFIHSDPPKAVEVATLRSYLEQTLAPTMARVRLARPTLLVGTSGTLQNLAAMAAATRVGKLPAKLANQRLKRKDLARLTALILEVNARERANIPGLDNRRVDIVPAGAVLAQVLMEGSGLDTMRVCDWALREGIILDFISSHAEELEAAEKVPDVRRRSVLRLAHRFRHDEAHANHVAHLALSLFDAIQPIHKMGPGERELLEYAALLHDIGLYVSHAKHHRHSYYLITQGELRGFSAEEIEVMALVARFHKGAPPKPSSEELANLAPKTRQLVLRLVALLRLADSLDRSHHRIVTAVRLGRGNGALELRIDSAGRDAELELWAASRKGSELWEKYFGTELKLRLTSGGNLAR